MRGLLALLLLLTLIAGCATEPPTPTATPTPDATPTITPTPRPAPVSAARTIELTIASDPAQQAFVRVINAATMTEKIAGLDVYIEGLSIANNLSLGQFTEPLGIVAGEYTLRVMPGGIRLSAGEPIFQTPIAPKGRESLIYLLTGTPSALALTPITESNEPLNSDQSRVTFLNATSAEIVAQPGGVTLAPAQMSSPLELPAGETTFNFGSLEQVLNLQNRTSYTLVLVGTPDNLQVITAKVAVPGVVSIRAINGLLSGDAVDVYVGDTLLAGNLAFGQAGERLSLPATLQPIQVFDAGANRDTAEPIARAELNPNPNADETLSFIVVGDVADASNVQVVTQVEDLSPTPPDTTRVSFVNALNTAPQVRIDTQAGPPPGIGDLKYGAQPQTSTLTASPYTFFWNRTDDAEQVEYAPDVTFEAGRVYLYLLTGQTLGEPPVILSDEVGFITAAQSDSTYIRIVNATANSVAFAVDGTTDSSNYGFSDGTPLLDVTPGDHTLEVRQGPDTRLSLNTPVEEGTTTSFFAYTDPSDSPIFLTLTDIVDGTPAIRLVNVTTSSDTRFSLALFPLTQPSGDTSRLGRSDLERGSKPMGVQAVVGSDAANESASVLLPVPTGAHQVYVMDGDGRVAATINQIVFEAGQIYDIVVDQRPDSTLVDAFVISYAVPE